MSFQSIALMQKNKQKKKQRSNHGEYFKSDISKIRFPILRKFV